MKPNAIDHRLTKVFTVEGKAHSIVAKISLSECGNNGYENFSLTGEIYDLTQSRRDPLTCGCIHDDLLEHFPTLVHLVALHLSDQDGIPMYGVANGFYWFTGCFPDALGSKYAPNKGRDARTEEKCKAIMQEHLRATDAEMLAIFAANPRTEVEFSAALESLGFRAKWKAEALAGIKQLEQLSGQFFESQATRINWEPLDPTALAIIEDRKANGYYSPEAVAKRDREKLAKQKADALAEVEAHYAKEVTKLDNQRLVARFVVELTGGRHGGNMIYYDHTNEIGVTKDAFDQMTQKADMSKLPSGVRFRFNEKSAY